MSDRPTKAELEAKLKAKGEEISGRFDALESRIPGSGSKVGSVLLNKRSAKVGLAIGAGFLVGVFVLGRRRRSSGIDFGEELDHLSDRLGSEIARRLSRGMSPDDAARNALEDVPPVVEVGAGSESVWSGAARQLIKSASSVVAAELGNWLQARLRASDLEENESPPAADG